MPSAKARPTVRRGLTAAVLAGVLAGVSLAAADAPTAFVGATVIDGTGAPPIADAVVIVDEGRIAAVGPSRSIAVPAGANVVEVPGKWIIPGLIDAHVHFFQSGGLYARPDVIDLRSIRPYEDEVARTRAAITATLARYLASGITGVVDMGGPTWTFGVRERARDSDYAPRVAVAGPLLGTYAPPALRARDPSVIAIRTPDEARAAVRRQVASDPDFVKIWFVFPGPDIAPQMAWVRAAISESHAAGVRVVAHATQARVARAMVDAGVDVLAHGVDDRIVDDDLLALMRTRGVIYVTTLAVHEGYAEVLGQNVRLSGIERRIGDPKAIASFAELGTLPARLRARWPRRVAPAPVRPAAGRNLARAAKARITVAAGSDAGNIGTLHGPALHRELELMVDAGGLSPMEVLVAASLGGAAVMGRTGDLGTLEAGKLADLVILDADPLADIRNTRRIHRVVKGGVVSDPADIMARITP